MNANPNRWRRLTPAMVAVLKEEGAVFEIASLVRTVHLIGCAEGDLRARLQGFVGQKVTLPPSPGGYYFRYETAVREKDAFASRLSAFKAGHRGQLPTLNRGTTHALRVASRHAA